LIDQLVLGVVVLDTTEKGYAEWRSGDRAPEFAQRIDATLRRIAGDDRRIDGANRDSGNPIGMQISFGQGLVNACLIGAERAAAAALRRNKPTVLALLLASRRRSECSPAYKIWDNSKV
jgi:hypothetical protein